MRYYKYMCFLIAVDIALFSLISTFYKPHAGTSVFTMMKYSFFIPLVVASFMQLAGLFVNIANGHVNTLRMYRFVVYKYDESPFSFVFGVAIELVLWTLPAYAILKFLAESN